MFHASIGLLALLLLQACSANEITDNSISMWWNERGYWSFHSGEQTWRSWEASDTSELILSTVNWAQPSAYFEVEWQYRINFQGTYGLWGGFTIYNGADRTRCHGYWFGVRRRTAGGHRVMISRLDGFQNWADLQDVDFSYVDWQWDTMKVEVTNGNHFVLKINGVTYITYTDNSRSWSVLDNGRNSGYVALYSDGTIATVVPSLTVTGTRQSVVEMSTGSSCTAVVSNPTPPPTDPPTDPPTSPSTIGSILKQTSLWNEWDATWTYSSSTGAWTSTNSGTSELITTDVFFYNPSGVITVDYTLSIDFAGVYNYATGLVFYNSAGGGAYPSGTTWCQYYFVGVIRRTSGYGVEIYRSDDNSHVYQAGGSFTQFSENTPHTITFEIRSGHEFTIKYGSTTLLEWADSSSPWTAMDTYSGYISLWKWKNIDVVAHALTVSGSQTNAPALNLNQCPTPRPTKQPTKSPTTKNPTKQPTPKPTTKNPTKSPTAKPTTKNPTKQPTPRPTTKNPTKQPTKSPTTKRPTKQPTKSPTTKNPTKQPTKSPTTKTPTKQPTTKSPTKVPTNRPTAVTPTKDPTNKPTRNPTQQPTVNPTALPTKKPTVSPTFQPTVSPTERPTAKPTSVGPGDIACGEYMEGQRVGGEEVRLLYIADAKYNQLILESCKSHHDTTLRLYDENGMLLKVADDENNFALAPCTGGHEYAGDIATDRNSYVINPGDQFTFGITGYTTADYGYYYVELICIPFFPTQPPTDSPTSVPSPPPTQPPTKIPTTRPSDFPTVAPTTDSPTTDSRIPTKDPTNKPTRNPTQKPTASPTPLPTKQPTERPTAKPTSAGPGDIACGEYMEGQRVGGEEVRLLYIADAKYNQLILESCKSHHDTTLRLYDENGLLLKLADDENNFALAPCTGGHEYAGDITTDRNSYVINPGDHFTFGISGYTTADYGYYYVQLICIPFFPTQPPTASPTSVPSPSPTQPPTKIPTTRSPLTQPSHPPTPRPSDFPTVAPTTDSPTKQPSKAPTTPKPSPAPTKRPTQSPTDSPSRPPTTPGPTVIAGDPSRSPTLRPTVSPTSAPITSFPTEPPTATNEPTASSPETDPSGSVPTLSPSSPSVPPTRSPLDEGETHPPTVPPTTSIDDGSGANGNGNSNGNGNGNGDTDTDGDDSDTDSNGNEDTDNDNLITNTSDSDSSFLDNFSTSTLVLVTLALGLCILCFVVIAICYKCCGCCGLAAGGKNKKQRIPDEHELAMVNGPGQPGGGMGPYPGFAGPYNAYGNNAMGGGGGNGMVAGINAGLPPPPPGVMHYGNGAQNIALSDSSSDEDDELNAAAGKDIPQSFGLINAFMLSRKNKATKGAKTAKGPARNGASIVEGEGFQQAPLTVEGAAKSPNGRETNAAAANWNFNHNQYNPNNNSNNNAVYNQGYNNNQAPAAFIQPQQQQYNYYGHNNFGGGGNYQQSRPQKQPPRRRPPPPPLGAREMSPDNDNESMYGNNDPVLELSKVTNSGHSSQMPSNPSKFSGSNW